MVSNSHYQAGYQEILEIIFRGEYEQASSLLRTKHGISDSIEAAKNLFSQVNCIFPGPSSSIKGSRLLSSDWHQGLLHRPNSPSQFLFHTQGPRPWVVVNMGRMILSHEKVYLYNRCGSKEIAERLRGCQIQSSPDGVQWDCQSLLEIDDGQLYEHKPIEFSRGYKYQYLRISRECGDQPIHLSQVCIGRPIESLGHLTALLNVLLAQQIGAQTDEYWRIREHSYKPHYLGYSIFDLSNQISLRLAQNARFSNFLIQLSNAVWFAYKHKIPIVYVSDDERARSLFPIGDTFTCRDLPVEIRIGQPRGLCIKGRFFYTNNLHTVFHDFPGMRYLVESFRHGCDLDPKIADSNQRLLTIHIRSGDIFETNIHPPYGQPPLAFYLRAIAHYQPDLITLVFENMSNPVISSLIEHVRGLKLPLTVSSSTDLRDDIRTLVAARALVIGKGTFALGVLC